MSEPKPTYTPPRYDALYFDEMAKMDDDMGATCPSCGVDITIANAGGYRTYCDGCCISGDGYTLFVGNCLNVMGNMADDTIDLTVTSPPYDNLRDYGKDFDADTFDWRPIIKELYRVTAVGGVVVWVVADATINGRETGTSFRQALRAMECGFRLHDTMIWKKDGAPFPESVRYKNNFEYMFVFSKDAPKTFNPICDKENIQNGRKIISTDRNADGTTRKSWGTINNQKYGKFSPRFNVWEINAEKRNSIRQKHPAAMSEALANDHIISWSNPGDLVFDPFLGSGTTGKMAIRNGRKFIGCDIDATYVRNIAAPRIMNQAGDYVTTDKEKQNGQVALWDMLQQ